MTYYGAMTKNRTEVAEAEEAAAIAACDHTRATVQERDTRYSPDGFEPIGVVEFIWCPDCPLGDWFDVDTEKERYESL